MTLAMEIAPATSLGTGTTKTQLGGQDITLPADAKCIVGIVPYICSVTPTAGEAVIAKCELESDDFTIQPYAVPFPPIAGHLSTAGNAEHFVPPLKVWEVYCPVKGGDRLRVYGTALASNTVAPYAGCGIIISDQMPEKPQVKAKMGTLTSTGTTVGEVAGTAYTFTGGTNIIGVYGIVVNATVSASKPYIGYIRLSSSEFEKAFPMKFPVQPLATGLGAEINCALSDVIVHRVDMPIKSPTTIQDYFKLEVGLTTAGKFVTGVLYI
ncbi:MAG: hypothetical protein KIH08_16825 [Candidatus Freyarchaeota archaeon]|nr:hypothetical protein [Candidatus Jordarchaeia archaeon]